MNKHASMTMRRNLFLVFLAVSLSSYLSSVAIFLVWQRYYKMQPPGPFALLTLALLLILSGATSFLVSALLFRRYRRILRYFNDVNERVVKGDFSIWPPKPTTPEFGQLRDAFNHMLKELENVSIFRNDFISSFTHEFKTPIVSIQGFARQLMRSDLSDEQRMEYAAIIAEEAQRLSRLSSNILRLSRLDSGSDPLEITSFRLDEQLRSCILLLEREWSAKDLQLKIDMPPVTCENDSSLLQEVWINLLGNAIKYSPRGGAVTVRMTRTEETAVVSISDEGIGMSQETMGKMYDKFFQGENAARFSGNGLGLSLAKRILDLTGGEISAVSQLGKGATFTVKIRLRR